MKFRPTSAITKVMFWACIAIFSVVAITTVALLFAPDKYYKKVTIHLVKRISGGELSIGNLTTQRSFMPTVELRDVALTNPQSVNAETLFTAEILTATFSLPDLLKGWLNISKLQSVGLELQLEKHSSELTKRPLKEGKNSDNNPSDFPIRVQIDELLSENTTINYINTETDVKLIIELPKTSLQTSKDKSIHAISLAGTINNQPISFVGSLPRITTENIRFSKSQLIPLTFAGTIGEIELKGIGELNTIKSNPEFNSELSVSFDSLSALNSFVPEALPDIGPIKIKSSLNVQLDASNSSSLHLPAFSLQIDDSRLSLKAEGAVSSLLRDNTGEIDIEIASSDLKNLIASLNLKHLPTEKAFPAVGKISATLSSTGNRLDLEINQATLKSEYIDSQAQGNVVDLLNTATTDIDLAVQVPDLSLVTHLFNQKMPPEWGPIESTAKLVGERGLYRLDDIIAMLNGRSTAVAKGHIESLYPFDRMKLDATANLSTLAEISAFTPKPLPDIGPMTGHGTVLWQDGKLSLVEARAKHDTNYGLMVLTGKIGDLIHFDGARIRADAALPNFSALDLFTGMKMMPVDSIVASANLITDIPLDLTAKNLELVVVKDGVQVNGIGTVHSILRSTVKPDIKLSSTIKAITDLEPMVNVKLPEIGPVFATGKLGGIGKAVSLSGFNAVINDRFLSGTLSSDGAQLNKLNDASLSIDIRSHSLRDTLAQFRIETKLTAPATLTGTAKLQPNELNLDGMKFGIKNNIARGSLALEFSADRPLITGDISIENLDMLDLNSLSNNIQDDKHSDSFLNSSIFSKQSLNLEQIADYELDVFLTIKQFNSTLFDISDATLPITATNGVLTLGPLSAKANGGDAKISIIVDSQKNPIITTVSASLDQIDMSLTGLFKNTDLVSNLGGTYARLNLVGEGDSISAFVKNANGEGGIYIENLVVKQGALKLVSSDVLDQLTELLNPFKKKKSETAFKCSALAFRINNGLLETPFGFAVESSDFSVIGNGIVDFNNESLDVEFSSKPRKGIGLSFSKIASLVKVSGPLADPRISLSRTGLLKFSASLAASIASGGASLIAEGLYEKQQANSGVCAKALGQ